MQRGLEPNGVGVTVGSVIAGSIISALSTLFPWRQSLASPQKLQFLKWLEIQLEKERDQVPLWVPVAVGCGISSWFILADTNLWLALILSCIAIALAGFSFLVSNRTSKSIVSFALLMAAGCGVIWIRSFSVAAPVLERPTVVSFYAKIEKVEDIAARDLIRLTLRTHPQQELPPKVRVNVPTSRASAELQNGAIIKLRARLMPPAMPALPGAYNFAERAWFLGLGATGQALGDIEIIESADAFPALSKIRSQLSAHVQSQMKNAAGAIGATLATGDRGAIDEADAEAMRRSGLAHLLSISGLHVTAIVGAAYLLVIKILAFFPNLALRWKLPVVAACAAAFVALGYTLMTGAQVPTIRACVAALLVLIALMMGRNALTLRMVAAGALFVMVLWPETLVGPSFQLSFAAVTAIIALHEHPRMKALLMRRDEKIPNRIGRIILSLFLTGLVVEIALMPIALFHFHKAGIYGAMANIIAIPLTTFVIMPLEALALLLDSIGMGRPVWWICEKALLGLTGLAHFVSTRPGAVTMVPTVPISVFGLIISGGLWFCLWRLKWRYLGIVPMIIGLALMAFATKPDIYIAGDGRQIAIRTGDGQLAMVRKTSGQFIKSIILENAGIDGEAVAIEELPGADCNDDSCTIVLDHNNRDWTILVTRSAHYIPALALSAACRKADIVISERRLPESCVPRWLKADKSMLMQTGGMTINLDDGEIEAVLDRSGRHEWMRYIAPRKFNGKSDGSASRSTEINEGQGTQPAS